MKQGNTYHLTFLVFICFLLSATEVNAHSPIISIDNEGIDSATFIADPIKSWAIYGELHERNEVDYYYFKIQKGQRIYISLMKPTNPDNSEFMPGFVLMGPGLINQGNISEYIEQPSGSNTVVVMGKQPAEATYEAFAPSSFFQLAELKIPAPDSGTYYIAVFEPERDGHYSLAIGERESFSLKEWIFIPINLISVYEWEGQSLFMIFLPIIVTFAVCLLIFWKKNWMPETPFEWAGIMAGFLFIGTGSSVIFQMLLALYSTRLSQEALITVIFALLPLILGIAVIRSIMKNRENVYIKKRAYLAALGIIALFVWAGLLVGPMLAVLASIIPARKQEPSKEKKIK